MPATFFHRLSAAIPFVLASKTKRLMRLFRPELLEQIEQYPSLINSGYLHIERTVELARHLGLEPSEPIIDVGAATGEVALMFSRSYPQAPIYCFEPVNRSFQQLVQNTVGQTQIVARNLGLGSQPGRAEIQMTHRITSSSLLPLEEDIHDKYLAENIRKVGTENVTVSTLDNELDDVGQINIVKMDVQGYELEVLRGGLKTLERTNLVLLEVQNHGVYKGAPRYFELDAFLRDHNFTLFNIVPSIRQNKKMYEWDAIYVNNRIATRFDT